MSTSKDQFIGIEEKLLVKDYAGAIAQIEENELDRESYGRES